MMSKLPPLGQGITIWFDTGGPVGGPYNTIVQNGAMQAASDLGADVKYLYSDWNPEKMVDNLKKSIADCAAMAQRKQFYQNPSTIKNHAETFCPKIKPRSRPES